MDHDRHLFLHTSSCGPVAQCPVVRCLVPLIRWSVSGGPVSDGPVSGGPVVRCPVVRCPVVRWSGVLWSGGPGRESYHSFRICWTSSLRSNMSVFTQGLTEPDRGRDRGPVPVSRPKARALGLRPAGKGPGWSRGAYPTTSLLGNETAGPLHKKCSHHPSAPLPPPSLHTTNSFRLGANRIG